MTRVNRPCDSGWEGRSFPPMRVGGDPEVRSPSLAHRPAEAGLGPRECQETTMSLTNSVTLSHVTDLAMEADWSRPAPPNRHTIANTEGIASFRIEADVDI